MKKKQNSDKQQIPALRVADVMPSLPEHEKWQMIADAINKSKGKRIKQGFKLGVIKESLYSIAFEDAIEWMLGNGA
jgi:hypothetical protein